MRSALAWAAAVALLPGAAARAEAGTERRVVRVNVLGEDGTRVPGLTAGSFRGEFRGRPVKVLAAAEESAARDVAIVVDVSGSQGGREGEATWRAAERFAGGLVPRHRVVVLTAGETLKQHGPLTSDPETLRKALSDARARAPWGPSALLDGVLKASLGFPGTGTGSAVCLFSDGEDTSSTIRGDELGKALVERGVRLFAVQAERPPRAPVTAPLEETGRWTRVVAEATGGLVVRLRLSGELPSEQALPQLWSSIADVYRLELEFPAEVDKLRDWKLEVRGQDGSRLRNVRLVYPRSIAPAPPHP